MRPANFAPQCPGRGCAVFDTPAGPLAVVNLQGRFTLDPNTDNPFLTADAVLEGLDARMILVDFHAEATSEKTAMGYYLDGPRQCRLGHAHARADLRRPHPAPGPRATSPTSA